MNKTGNRLGHSVIGISKLFVPHQNDHLAGSRFAGESGV
jgi:hypothetical protein